MKLRTRLTVGAAFVALALLVIGMTYAAGRPAALHLPSLSPTPASLPAARSPSVGPAASPTPSGPPTATAPARGSPVAAISARATPATPSNATLPLRAAFYYPWFPQAWTQSGLHPFTHYLPTPGFYDGASPAVIRQQIAAMQYGNIQAGIASWWGQGSQTDQRISTLLAAAASTGFRWSIYYEAEAQGDPSVDRIRADLVYIKARYGSDPAYLRLNGGFVVFVYAQPGDGCGMADRWKQANTVGAYVVLKVFPGYAACASQPDGWHQYSPSSVENAQAGHSYSISPGFFKATEASPRLVRDQARWTTAVRDMVASHAAFQLVTTFNEWGEGTAVESASQWASPSGYGVFLDALHAVR